MKTRLTLVLGLILLCSACTAVPIQPATATEADLATEHIWIVENNAFGRASRVIWVHPPRNEDLEKDG